MFTFSTCQNIETQVTANVKPWSVNDKRNLKICHVLVYIPHVLCLNYYCNHDSSTIWSYITGWLERFFLMNISIFGRNKRFPICNFLAWVTIRHDFLLFFIVSIHLGIFSYGITNDHYKEHPAYQIEEEPTDFGDRFWDRMIEVTEE